MPVTPLKMNLDYESQLAEGKSSEKINHGLEYLAFYLSSGPFATTGNYSEEFLRRVERMSGTKPEIYRGRDFENMWGPGTDLVTESELNSKLLSARLTQKIASEEEIRILHSPEDLSLNFSFPLVCKYPHAMSGRGVKKILSQSDLLNISFPCVLEPLRNRVHDFSHFIYPSGEMITYENLVDKNFQYKGTVFHEMKKPGFDSIPWAKTLSNAVIKKYKEELKLYRQHFEKLIPKTQKNFGYSIDSFVYEEAGELKIRTCSEFNFRRTMGWLTYELGKKISPKSSWIGLRLFMNKSEMERDFLRLSPEEARFQAVLLTHTDSFNVHEFPDTKL